MPQAPGPLRETADKDAAGHQAAMDRGTRRRPASERELAVLPAPEPGRVNAARSQLTARYAADVDAMLWAAAGRPLLDLQAVSAVLETAHAENGSGRDTSPQNGQARGPVAGDGQARDTVAGDGQARGTASGDSQAGEDPVGALDLGAALIVLAALRLDIDRMEANLMDEVLRAGLTQEFIASALGIPVPQAMKRHRLLGERRNFPVDRVTHAAALPAPRHP